MPWKDVCKRGHPAGGRVREDDPGGGTLEEHDAGGPSPGIVKFIHEVVRTTPVPNVPAKPLDFPVWCLVQDYPGRKHRDGHLEGRSAEAFPENSVPVNKT